MVKLAPKLILLFACALALIGCATKTYAPDQAPEMVTVSDFTGFFRFGPMQSGGPDASLKAGTRVKLLRNEMGYSLVMLDDERTGYVANECLAPAPPRPKPQPGEVAAPGADSRGRASRKGRYTGEQVNDSALPEPVPPPSLDLNIGPEDMVETPPQPSDSQAQQAPKFRY